MTSLRYNRKNLTISTSLFVIVLILVSFVFYRAGVAPLFSMGTPTALALLVFMSLLVLVVISLGIFQSIGLWTYRIEFDDTFLETHMARVPFAWHFKCAYADITQQRKADLSLDILFILLHDR